MFLSIVVPVYNGEKHLEACLRSLLAQDLPQEDYEILCVDDGSTDGSPAILRRFAGENANVRILRQANGGVAAARNTGAANAAGEYLWFVDCDDRIAPNCLAGLRELAQEGRYDRLIVGAYQFTEELTEDELRQAREGKLPANAPWYDSVVWRSLLRRAFLEEHQISFRYPELTHGEDGLYMYELTRFAPADREAEQTVYFYRVHADSAETAAGAEALERRLRSHAWIAEILWGYYQAGRRDTATADKLMSMLWLALYEIARLPRQQAQAALAALRGKGLFPFRRPPECSITRSYMSGRTGAAERAFDAVYLRLHTPAGYALMRCVLRLLRR